MITPEHPLVATDKDGTPTTTSLIIAEGTDNEHRSVLQLIRNNLGDFEEFGPSAFEMRKSGGRPTQVAILNEEQAALLMTYMRNTPIVRDFKKKLVRAFFTLRDGSAPQSPELAMAHGLIAAQQMLEAKDHHILELEAERDANRPAVDYVNTHVIAGDDVMLIEDWGRTYGLTKPQSFALLRDEKDLIFQKKFERWSRTKGRKVTEIEYRPRAGKPSYTWFDVKEQRDAPRRNNGQARKTLYIKALHAVDLARLVGLLPNIEVAS